MGNKKDIGIVIKEKLKNLDKSPNDNGWNAIQSDLDKKKKRRLIPFWFSYVGIFFAGILFSWLIFNNSFDQNSFFNLKENSITTKEKKNGNLNSTNIESSNKNTNSNDSILNSENNSSIINKEKIVFNDKIVKSKVIVKTNSKIDSNKKNTIKTKIANFTSKNKSNRNKSFSKTKKLYTYKEKVASTNKSNFKKNNDFTSEANSNETIDNSFSTKEFAGIENKNSSEDITAKTIAKDSLKNKRNIPTTNKDSITKTIEKEKSFAVFVYGSPTTSVFSSNNSSLDNRLNSNSKKAEITFSYGAYLCYYGTGNLSLRIGIGKNNLKYTTQNVPVNTFNYSNIGYSNGFSNAIIYSQSNNSEYMNIIQDISYIEIPLEAKYKFLNKKVGLCAIIGINHLILDKNEVSVVTENGLKYKIGKTANQFESTFGANLGLGLDYKLSKNIKFNIEPMLKYQLRSNQEETKMNPFNFNILTGFEFNLFNNK